MTPERRLTLNLRPPDHSVYLNIANESPHAMMNAAVCTAGLSTPDIERFEREGYLVLHAFAPAAQLARLQRAAHKELAARREPVEYESLADYPGLPERAQSTGTTVRRLLQAYERHPAFAQWAQAPAIVQVMRQLLGEDIRLVRNHHNCLMTKHPQGGSRTGWHRDTRYWHFQRPELVNAWLALDAESPDNGGLRIVPGSHRIDFEPERLDAALFLRDDARNQDLLRHALPVRLQPGDVLLFHSHLLHAAGANRTDRIKHSLVFTYRATDNTPLADTRSARLADIDPGRTAEAAAAG